MLWYCLTPKFNIESFKNNQGIFLESKEENSGYLGLNRKYGKVEIPPVESSFPFEPGRSMQITMPITIHEGQFAVRLCLVCYVGKQNTPQRFWSPEGSQSIQMTVPANTNFISLLVRVKGKGLLEFAPLKISEGLEIAQWRETYQVAEIAELQLSISSFSTNDKPDSARVELIYHDDESLLDPLDSSLSTGEYATNYFSLNPSSPGRESITTRTIAVMPRTSRIELVGHQSDPDVTTTITSSVAALLPVNAMRPQDMALNGDVHAVEMLQRRAPFARTTPSAAEKNVPVLTVSIESLKMLHQTTFPVDAPTRLNVATPQTTIPLLVVRRPSADRTVIFSNGAVDLSRSGRRPIFQRSTWWREVEGHQIFVCDPGTVGPSAVGLSWGHLSTDYWAVPDIAQAVRSLSQVLGIHDPEQRLYTGSSGGGFLSIGLCHYDPGSHAIVNNAQLDWTKWMVGAVDRLRKARFDNLSPAEIRDRWPTTSSVLRLLQTTDFSPKIDYLVNTASTHDSNVELVEMESFIKDNPKLARNLRVFKYRDTVAGHNPLGKPHFIGMLNGRIEDMKLPDM